MVKVVWLTQYNVFNLLPSIKLNRKVILHNSSWIHNLSAELALRNEIELHIITHSQLVDYSQSILKDNINFHIIKYSLPFTNKGFPWFMPFDKLTGYYSFSKEAQIVISKIKPDVMHIHGTEGGYFMPAFQTNIPSLISIQGIIGEIIKVEPSFNGYLQLFYEQYAIKKGKHFGCRTNFDFSYIRKMNKKAIIHDLPEAMNKVFFDSYWTPGEGLVIVFVGSVLKRKGIEDIIEAIAILKQDFPNVILKVIGSGDKKYISSLQLTADNLKVKSNIAWLGNRKQHEIAAELSKCNLFVLPTLVDNSPNCLAEAMAVGVPCIATEIGGIPSMVKDKYDGMLFKKHDINGLVNIVKQLVKDKELQTRLSVNAKAKAFKRNHPDIVSAKYLEVYKSLAI